MVRKARHLGERRPRGLHYELWSRYDTRDEARQAASGLERQTGQATYVKKLGKYDYGVYASIDTVYESEED